MMNSESCDSLPGVVLSEEKHSLVQPSSSRRSVVLSEQETVALSAVSGSGSVSRSGSASGASSSAVTSPTMTGKMSDVVIHHSWEEEEGGEGKDSSEQQLKKKIMESSKAAIEQHNTSEASVAMLNEARLSKWITCFCVITFDLELGQSMELMYPSYVKLSNSEKSSICYMSFPDSNVYGVGDTFFCFRIARSTSVKAFENLDELHMSVGRNSREMQSEISSASSTAAETGQNVNGRSGSNGDSNKGKDEGVEGGNGNSTKGEAVRDKKFHSLIRGTLSEHPDYYCFVYFRQTRDETNRRGYFQKSLVIVSVNPFLGLFRDLLHFVAPAYFNDGMPLIESVCQNISNWPEPVQGGSFDLAVLGEVLKVHIPMPMSKPIFLASEAFLSGDAWIKNRILASLQSVDTYRVLKGALPHLWLLWELVLLGKPIVVMSPTPDVCSEAVLALVCLISPLKIRCDFRPYFTIHDQDFDKYVKSKTPDKVIIGCTNPLLVRSFGGWPNVLKIGDISKHKQNRSPSPMRSSKFFEKRNSGSAASSSQGGGSPLGKGDWKDRFVSLSKPRVEKDKQLLRKLVQKTLISGENDRTVHERNVLIQRHFMELTEGFMIPLERYFSSLMPLAKEIAPWKKPPTIANFNEKRFLVTVEKMTTLSGRLPAKGDWTGLYKSFLKSSNFVEWFEVRRGEANRQLLKAYLDQLCQVSITEWVNCHGELELVDCLMKFRSELTDPSLSALMTSTHVDKIEENINVIINSLPSDLKTSLQAN
eukprot:Nk52_evm8s639 gene=Nk52_evmTU8s639